MELLKALEIIIKDNTKKIVSKDFNGYIHRVVSTEVANEGKYVIVWNDGYNVKLSARLLAADWEIQDKTTEEQESIDIVTYINKELGTSYDSEDEIDYINIIENYKFQLSEEFIDKIIQKNDNEIWYDIIEYQKLSEDFIREFIDKIHWHSISVNQKLSETFIREFSDKVDWKFISCYQTLSEDLIREFADKVNWYYISESQKLSENFIIEYQDKVYWEHISKYQKLSKEFLCEFKDKIHWSTFLNREDISHILIDEIIN